MKWSLQLGVTRTILLLSTISTAFFSPRSFTGLKIVIPLLGNSQDVSSICAQGFYADKVFTEVHFRGIVYFHEDLVFILIDQEFAIQHYWQMSNLVLFFYFHQVYYCSSICSVSITIYCTCFQFWGALVRSGSS